MPGMLLHLVADDGTGDLAFAFLAEAGAERRWMELFLRGGSAFEAFGRPPFEAEVTVEPG